MTKTAPFSKEFLKKIKDILLAEKTKLETELAKFTKKNPHVEGDFEAEFPEYGDEDDDNAREVADYSVNKTLETTLEKNLRDVNAALDRLEKGTYGICKYTGEPIDEKRLLARPTSSSSVAAKKVLTDER